MKKLLLVAAMAISCSFTAQAQNYTTNTIVVTKTTSKPQEILVADETWYKENATNISIRTANNNIFVGIVNACDGYVKATASHQKKDSRRGEQYWEYRVTLQKDGANALIKYLDHLNNTAKN